MKLRFSSRGLSLVELMTVVGIMGFLGLAISSAFTDVFKMQSKVVGSDEANEFASSMGRYFFNEATCTAALKNKIFPANGSLDLSLSSYVGYGYTASSGPVRKGSTIGQRLRVRDLKLTNKNMPPETVYYDGSKLLQYLAQVDVGVDLKMGKRWEGKPSRSFEFPVFVNPANKAIVKCMSGTSIRDSCAALGLTFDPATGICNPVQQCIFEGMFSTNSCTGNSNPSDCPPDTVNEVTKSTSCLSGTQTKKATGTYNWSFVVSCGKKCSQTVQVETKYYICLRCK